MEPEPPVGLDEAGRNLWTDMIAECAARGLEYEPHELTILRHACREEDLIARMQADIDESETLVAKGSMGQPVAHPLTSEIRQHRATQQRLLKDLVSALEDPATRSVKARAAVNVRWDRQRGAAAR